MKLRDQRIVISNNQIIKSKLTLWVGIYNGLQYLDSIKTQLMGQSTKEFNLMVVDNGSSDNSWDLLQTWLSAFEGRITLVKNPINMGFIGSMQLNEDLIDAEWILQIHQDDYYFKNHVAVHLADITAAASDVVAISSDMGSLRHDGKVLPTLPRASWFPVDQDLPSQFIQNLITLSVPWPSTSFKAKELFDSFIPWHNFAFMDVEITLRILTKGKVHHVKKQTMKYRENPVSASHSINDIEKRFGAAVGLTRIVSSNEFITVASKVNPSERAKFSKAIENGIRLRVGDSKFSEYIFLMASESMAFAWKYETDIPLDKIYDDYNSIQSASVLNLLGGLMAINGQAKHETGSSPNYGQFFKVLDEHNRQGSKSKVKKGIKSFVYIVFIQPLPYLLKRLIIEKALSLAIKMGVKHRWNFRWR